MITWNDESVPNVVEYHKAIGTYVNVAICRNSKGMYVICIHGHMFPTHTQLLETAKELAVARYRTELRMALDDAYKV